MEDFISDEHGRNDLRPVVEQVAIGLFEAREVEEASWPWPTDRDRLGRAFSELEGNGILVRQNYLCCLTCGQSAIINEIEDADVPVHGYCFFHAQDADIAMETGALWLAFGSWAADENHPCQTDGCFAWNVGMTIDQALRDQGLRTKWDGSHETRMCVVGIDWRQRMRVGN